METNNSFDIDDLCFDKLSLSDAPSTNAIDIASENDPLVASEVAMVSASVVDNDMADASIISETPIADETKCPHDIFIEMINQQKRKETIADIWKDSPYKDLVKLQSNNVGNVGETFIQELCNRCGITASIDGTKTKELKGGEGDGRINGKSVEIKTSHRGSVNASFQHELGETPWKSNYMLFIDIAPLCIYLTLFPNFTEEFYKSGKKCDPYFPGRSVTWRKGTGAFKLDTSIKINEENVTRGYTIRITDMTPVLPVRNYILGICN